MHISELCKNPKCEIKNCKLRHPKKCKFFRDYNRCKFGEWCFFSHETIENRLILDDIANNLNEKHETIEKKIENIDKKLSELETMELEITKKLENIFLWKIENLENTILTMKKCMVEKDEQIISFEARFRKIEKQIIHKETIQKTVALEKSCEESNIKCKYCGFITNSEQGLKLHMNRNHTESTEDKIDRTCNICEKNFRR